MNIERITRQAVADALRGTLRPMNRAERRTWKQRQIQLRRRATRGGRD